MFLCEGFLQLWQAGATLHRGAQAPHYRSLSCCGAQAPDVQAQQLWLTGLVALRHVGSSQARARTRVPCIGRQTLNHCATREAPFRIFLSLVFCSLNMIYTGLGFFWCLSCLVFSELPESVVWCLTLTWGKSQLLFFQVFLFSFLSFSGITHMLNFL